MLLVFFNHHFLSNNTRGGESLIRGWQCNRKFPHFLMLFSKNHKCLFHSWSWEFSKFYRKAVKLWIVYLIYLSSLFYEWWYKSCTFFFEKISPFLCSLPLIVTLLGPLDTPLDDPLDKSWCSWSVNRNGRVKSCIEMSYICIFDKYTIQQKL